MRLLDHLSFAFLVIVSILICKWLLGRVAPEAVVCVIIYAATHVIVGNIRALKGGAA